MGDDVPRSVRCTEDQHERCPHYCGVHDSLWRVRRGTVPTCVLCSCGCHARCPLAGRRTAPLDDWRQRCTCPGAVPLRRSRAQAEERRRAVTAVVAELRRTGHPDAAEVERRLREVHAAAGQPSPLGLRALSRVIAASSARRGTRTVRLLGLAARAAVSAPTWAWSSTGDGDEHNRAEARRGYRSAGTGAVAAALMTVAASRTRGRRRVLWAGAAGAAWLATAVAAALVTGVTLVVRAAEEHRLDQSGPGARRPGPPA